MKPWFLFRPAQIARRLRHRPGEQTARVPWGTLQVDSRETVGAAIARTGVYELAVSELIARLTEPGELCVDAGGNLGYMTSLLVSRGAQVVAYEPHPDLAERLRANAPAATVRQVAVSDTAGTAHLSLPDDFERNTGVATLAAEGIEVETVTLDSDLPDGPVGVLKIDVEGHELPALQGGAEVLARTRDVIFEDHEYPSAVSEHLSARGFTILGLHQSTWRLRLVQPGDARVLWEAPTYLATRDPDRAQSRMGFGWRVLRSA